MRNTLSIKFLLLPLFFLLAGCQSGEKAGELTLAQLQRRVRERMLKAGCDLTYNEGPGGHDWNFWDREIQSVLDWFLRDREKAVSGVIMG